MDKLNRIISRKCRVALLLLLGAQESLLQLCNISLSV